MPETDFGLNKGGKMKTWKVFLSALAGLVLLTGCISRKERVETRVRDSEPVVHERVIEKTPETTINVR